MASFEFSSDNDDDLSDSLSNMQHQALLRSLHYTVGKIVHEEQEREAGKEVMASPLFTSPSLSASLSSPTKLLSIKQQKSQMSKSAISCLTELTYHYVTKCLANDLLSFSQHAGRKTITVDDVKLVARKNPRGLLDSLERFCDNQQQQQQSKKSPIRFTGISSSRKRQHNNKDSFELSDSKAARRNFFLRDGDSSSSEEDDDVNTSLSKKSKQKENQSKCVGFDIQSAVDDSSTSSESKDDENGSVDSDINERFKRNQKVTGTRSSKEKKRAIIDSSGEEDALRVPSKSTASSIERRNQKITGSKTSKEKKRIIIDSDEEDDLGLLVTSKRKKTCTIDLLDDDDDGD